MHKISDLRAVGKKKQLKKALAVVILIEKARLGHELPFCTSIKIHANTVSLQKLCEIRTTVTRFSLCVVLVCEE